MPSPRAALFGLWAAAAAPVWSGPWLPEPGRGSLWLGLSYLTAAEVIDREGEARDYAVQELGFNVAVEAGLTPRLAVGAAWTPMKAVWSDSVDRLGITSGEASLTASLWKTGAHRFALKAAVGVPVGKENPSDAPDYLYALFSQGAWAGELQPQWGWARGKTWLQGLVGLRLRTHDFAPQARYGLGGGHAFGRVGLRLNFPGLLPLDTRSNGRPSDQELYYGWQAAVDYRFPAFTLGAQLDGMFTQGQELPYGGRANLILARKW